MIKEKKKSHDFPNNTILFDGVCNFCNFWVDFVIKFDEKKRFKFCFLQEEKSKKFISNNELKNVDTIVLLINNKIYTKSDAALKVMASMNKYFMFVYIFFLIPRLIRDFVYDFIGKNRYKIFGKSEFCRVPDKEDLDRFI